MSEFLIELQPEELEHSSRHNGELLSIAVFEVFHSKARHHRLHHRGRRAFQLGASHVG